MNDTRYRVKNMCRYDIGVRLTNGISMNIPAGSFLMMTSDDIAYVESLCSETKFFAKRMLVPFDSQDQEVSLNEMGLYVSEEEQVHMSDEDIKAALKQSTKKIEAWLKDIDDPAELDSIVEVAKEMDLPASKVKVIMAKMPNSDIIE